MLSRMAESAQMMTSNINTPFQSSGRTAGIASGILLSSK